MPPLAAKAGLEAEALATSRVAPTTRWPAARAARLMDWPMPEDAPVISQVVCAAISIVGRRRFLGLLKLACKYVVDESTQEKELY